MQDYYHYAYKCPYFSQVTKYKLICERGCTIWFKDKHEAKRFLKNYCCGDYNQCSIAHMLNEFWEGYKDD